MKTDLEQCLSRLQKDGTITAFSIAQAFEGFVSFILAESEDQFHLFLDDLQWIDPASLNLLKAIAMDAERHSLLIIGAYRDNEVCESHPLIPMLDELKKEEMDVRTLRLNNLQEHHWEDLLTDTLKTRKEVVELARLLYEKTNGNPFFTRRLLKKLKEEGQFAFDTVERRWTYAMDAIFSQPISDNVTELLSERIRRLPVETQQILKLAAYLGNRFDLSILSVISEQTEEAINKALIPALSERIIITAGGDCLFVHDLIQQTAYQLTDEGEKEALHLHIGRVLLNQWSGEQRLENIFALADHLNAGQSLIQKEEERIDLATLNLQTGTKAKETRAFTAARDYLREGVRNLPANSWETNYRLTFELNKELAGAEFLNGHLEKSQELIHEILFRTKLAVEKAEMYNMLIMLHTLKAEYEKAKDVGKHALNLLGFRLPEDNLEAVIAVTKLANLALEFGNIPEFLYGYAVFGSILSNLTGDYKSGYDLCKFSIELCNRYHNFSQLTRAYYILGARVLHWIKPANQALPLLSDGYKAALESGELLYAGYINETLTEADFLEQCKEYNQVTASCIFHILKAGSSYMYGNVAEALLSINEAKKRLSVIAGLHGILPQLCFAMARCHCCY